MGAQVSAVGVVEATKLIVVDLETPLRVAVTVALPLVLREPVVAAKVADVAPAATVTEAGTESAALELETATEEPPVGAAWFSVTVQVLEALDPRLVGAQVSAVGVVCEAVT